MMAFWLVYRQDVLMVGEQAGWPHGWCAGTEASWLVCLSMDQVVWVDALAGKIVWCWLERHFTLKVPLSTQGGIAL